MEADTSDCNGLNHPADQLALVRQRIKVLQEQEAELKATCAELPEADRVGRYNEVRVATVKRTALDTKALKEAMGETALAPFMKATEATVVTIKPMEG
jgi:hypothetical protein